MDDESATPSPVDPSNGGNTARPAPRLSVCLLITDFDATGGIQSHSRRLLQALHARGVATSVCSRNHHGKPRDEVWEGTVIHRTPVVGSGPSAATSLLYLADGLAWLMRRRAQFNVIHCQQMFGSAMLGLFAKALLRKPIVVRVTSTGPLSEVHQVRKLPPAWLRLRQLRKVDRWVALTTDMKSEVCTLDVPPERVAIIPNATVMPDETACEPGVPERHRAALGLDAPLIAVFSGRLSGEKGLDVLLRAWKTVHAEFPRARLLLLGAGGGARNVEAELRALCAELGLETAVQFLGYVPNVGDYLLASSLFVLPTRSEGMSNALVEAMAAGTAIVTTDIPANRDLVHHEVSALLVRPDDIDGLAAALLRLLREPLLAQRLGRAARAEAESNLSLETMTSRYMSLYTDMINS